jgi:hypothetical protein
MNIGIAEAVIRGRRGFYSQYELEQLLEQVLSIHPLERVYKHAKVLEPVSFNSERFFVPKEGTMDSLFAKELRLFKKADKAFRKKNHIHILALCIRSNDSIFAGDVLAHGDRFGEGMFYITDLRPQLFAHETGHLLGLGHFGPGSKTLDVMNLSYEKIKEAERFCFLNQEKIKYNASKRYTVR